MSEVENEAFIDLENALHERTERLWNIQWRDIKRDLNRLANAGDWDAAHRRCDEIDFTEIVADVKQYARTLAEAALFLGASRIAPPEKSYFYGAPDEFLIERGVEQWAIVLTRNAQEALRIQAHNTLADLEQKIREADASRIVKADPDIAAVGKAGSQYSRATASLMISRMSTAGFMLEASARGIKTYRVNEVMDAATCGICAQMHNKHFPVDDGLAQSTAIMSASDPESLKAIAPFPSQSRANVKAISNMGPSQMVSNGLHLPPYHPNCRGIVTLEDKNRAGSATIGGVSLAGGMRMIDSEGLTPDQVAARMFGDFDDLDDAFLASALGAGSAAVYVTDGDDG